MSEKGLEPLANLRETLWLLARALRLRTSDWRIFLPEGDNTRPLGRLFVLFFAGIHGQPAGRSPQLTVEVVHEDVPVNRTEQVL